jgi:rubredoxin-NAD+ reductase
MSSIVVIGAGLAGYGVVRELRRLDPAARLLLIADDDGHFYSKPMLSTALAKGKTAGQLVTTSAEAMAAGQKIEVMTQTRVARIDAERRVLETSAGEIAYSSLILALGAEPVKIALAGDAAGDVLSINHLEEYAQFRERLEGKTRVLIIGAGLVGSEFANDLSATGAAVTVVDPLALPLPTLVPPPVGEAVRDALAAQGVTWRFGESVRAVDRHGAGYRATLSGGEALDTDLVISAVGLRPRIALAAQAGLAVRRGIVVDDSGRTSDPHIYALGDCAEYTVGLCLYITPIMSAARAIAASVLGAPTAIKFPVLSVIVKTTACPIALLPPPPGVAGEWREVERDDEGLKYLFETADKTLVGYALTGAKTARRVDMDREIGALRAATAAA